MEIFVRLHRLGRCRKSLEKSAPQIHSEDQQRFAQHLFCKNRHLKCHNFPRPTNKPNLCRPTARNRFRHWDQKRKRKGV